MTLLAKLINAIRPPGRYWFAVRLTRSRAWLVDTCAGGTYDVEFGQSVWYDTAEEARDAMRGAELTIDEHTLVRLRVQPQTNHYAMKEIPWPS